jgi:hypothetical protein
MNDERGSFMARFERKVGETETAVKLHVPAATATLTVNRASPGETTLSSPPKNSAQEQMRSFVQLQNADESVQAYLRFDSGDSKTIKLAPGTYRVMNPMTMRPREDIQPIVLKTGELRTITYAPPPAGPAPATSRSGAAAVAASSAPRVTTQICYWTSDGVLVTSGKSKLVDDAGKAQESAGYGGVGALYSVTPGKYKAILERPEKEPHVKEVTVAAPGSSGDDETGGGRWSPIHIVLDD